MSRPRIRLPGLRPARRPLATTRRGGLAARITALANDLASVIDDAADFHLVAPTPVTNAVLDLRAWSARLFDNTTARPTAIDATRLLAHIRAMPDQQLLALLADLPWSRLDALLDAINEPPVPARASRSDDEPPPPGRA
jgi:hypothetical protein